MKKRIFKFGAALTAALMICSATAGLAFADEVEEAAPEAAAPVVEETVDEAAPAEDAVEEEAPAEDVEAPAEDVEAPAEDAEAPAEDVEEVVIPVEKEEVPVEDAAEVEAAAKVDDVATGSSITIGEISATADDSYFTVSVPFTVNPVPSQITLFVYDITAITSGDQNNMTKYTADTTPVGYINQYDGPASGSGTYTFKLAKTGDNAYQEGDIIVVKIGGTDVEVPDAQSFTLTAGGPTPEVMYGDANSDTRINPADAALVMKYARGKMTESDKIDLEAADVNADTRVNPADAALIMQYARGKINSFPAQQ